MTVKGIRMINAKVMYWTLQVGNGKRHKKINTVVQ